MEHGCEEPAYVGIGEKWVCKKHMEEEFKKVGEVIEQIVRNLLEIVNEQRR
jgi:hypothetical protein